MTRTMPAALLLAALLTGRVFALTDLQRGDDAPAIDLPTMTGDRFETDRADGSILVLLFGESGHERTRPACREIAAALSAPRLADDRIEWVLILTKGSRPEDMWEDVAAAPRPPTVAIDTDRQAFGAYKVAVLPTVVIVDGEGKVVHARAGFTNRFGDIVFDALSFATGKLSLEHFEQTLAPSETASPEEARLRAFRMAQFAQQLASRGLDDLAEARFLEAMKIDPDSVAARLGLGDLLLRQERYADADARFSEVLALEPGSPRGRLGLAWVQTHREPLRIEQASRTVDELLHERPDWARAQFLMGVIHERRGETTDAATCFKRAAELLLLRPGSETEPGSESAFMPPS